MSNPTFLLWLRELFGKWVKLMCSIAGLILSVLGWFFVPNTPGLRPFVIGAGVLALLFSSYLAWLAKHKALEAAHEELERILAKRPVIETDNVLEFDESSSLYRLLIKNTAKTTSPITAKIEQVIIGGQPHSDSARLPIKLQWMNHPGRDAVELGAEKVDVVFVEIVPAPIAYSSTLVWSKDKQGRPRARFPASSVGEPKCYLVIAGVSFDKFKISLNEGESVYCELALYGSENQPLSTKWCRFTRDSKAATGVVSEIVPLPPSLSG